MVKAAAWCTDMLSWRMQLRVLLLLLVGSLQLKGWLAGAALAGWLAGAGAALERQLKGWLVLESAYR